MGERALAVCLHDVEPASAERCAAIRQWLARRGVARVTLLAIPASGGRAVDLESPSLVRWMRDRVAAGDCVAQHGLTHERSRPAPRGQRSLRRWQGADAAEFPGLGERATMHDVRAGRAILERAGLAPAGFVAPGFAYTRALRDELEERWQWWATLTSVHRPGGRKRIAPALGLGASTPVKRALSPAVAGAGALAVGRLMRVDVHPADFDRPAGVRAIDRLIEAAGSRRQITLDDA